jgi:plasmid stabilization system protein ParE
MMDLILLLSADLDIQAAFNRYENYQSGRGEVFLGKFNAAFEVLRQNPQMGSPYVAKHRRLLVRDFPYGIFYIETPKRLVVVAVLDLRQNPRSITKRISERFGD